MHTFSVPAVHCDKMAVNNILFHQYAVIKFIVKENSCCTYLWGTSSHVWRCLLGCQQCHGGWLENHCILMQWAEHWHADQRGSKNDMRITVQLGIGHHAIQMTAICDTIKYVPISFLLVCRQCIDYSGDSGEKWWDMSSYCWQYLYMYICLTV